MVDQDTLEPIKVVTTLERFPVPHLMLTRAGYNRGANHVYFQVLQKSNNGTDVNAGQIPQLLLGL